MGATPPTGVQEDGMSKTKDKTEEHGHGNGYNHAFARANVEKAVTGKTPRERFVQFMNAAKKEYDSLETPEAKEKSIQDTFGDLNEIVVGLFERTD